MEIIAKISRGSKMDQVYLPRHREGFPLGSYVVVKPLETSQTSEKPYFYGLKEIEPVKLGVVHEIFSIISNHLHSYENIFISGSFLEGGFSFHDIDVFIIHERSVDEKRLKEILESRIKIKVHILVLSNVSLLKGLACDPLYQMMLSKVIAKKRFIYHTQREIDYKLLDLHLLKSKVLIDNFDILNGNEKYYLVRNMIAILNFIKEEKLSKGFVDREIEKVFRAKILDIQQNMLDKNEFLERFKQMYQKIFDLILEGVKHESKQK